MSAQDFFELFKGLERAHGRYDLAPESDDGQKQGGSARTVQESLTVHEWELHMKGERGRVVIPNREYSKVY